MSSWQDKLQELLVLIWNVIYYTIRGVIRAVVPVSWLPQKNVENEVVLITGTGSGLGRELALKFASKGSKLVLWDLNETQNAETKRLVDALGKHEALAYTVDISDRNAVYRVAESVLADVERVDILINNAGIVTGKKFLETTDEMVDKTMAVNAHSLFWIAKAFTPGMIERDHGHIVTIASMAGKVGVGGMVDYCASKFAAVGFSEALRAELRSRSHNLHVSLVCSYYISTGMFEGVKSSSPLLLPFMTPEYAAQRIFDAVTTNTVMFQLPRFCYVSTILKEVFPTEAAESIADFVGVNREMDTFKGSRSQKLLENGHSNGVKTE